MEPQRTNSGASQPSSTVQTPVCEICGQDFDVSKNLVVTTCKPCRRFLRKFEKTQLGDSCPFDGECEVAPENRSDCGPCRYNKYLKIRMERDSTTTPSAVNRAVTFSSLNRFHRQAMPPAVEQVQDNEESCKLCEQAPQGRKFKVMSGLLMCGRCRVLVAHNVKNQEHNPSNMCLRDDGICSDYPSLTSCSVCLFEKYKDLVTKAPKTKKSRAVSFRIATCPQNYTPTVHQDFVTTTSGVNQTPLSILDQQVPSEAAIPLPIDSTISASPMSPAPILQNSMAPEQCKICGDTVTILGNYGVVACSACVDFYARKLKSRHHQECKNAKRCKITVKNRNSCPTCRFEKCKSLGMVDKKSVETAGNQIQNNENAPDHRQNIENQPRASSSDLPAPQRKRPAETMLQDYGNQSVPNEPMEMCKLCKRVPEQYPHQLFQGIRMCQGCTDLIKHRNPVQMKCQKGNGECRIYCWVVDCSSCILKEYDELMEIRVVEQARSSNVPRIADKDFHMKRSRMQPPSPCHQDQEDHQQDPQPFDDNNGQYSQQMAGYSNEGYPSVSDSMNLEHHKLNVDYSSPQIDEVNPGPSPYRYNNSDPVDIEIGQEEAFTMADKSIYGDQIDQNTSHDPQLYDDGNDHYSEQMGFQNQGYFDDISLDIQSHSHNDDQSLNLQLDGLISPSKTYLSTSENMEYQNQYQDNECLNPQIEKLAPELHHHHSGNSDPSEIDDVNDRGNNSIGLHPEQEYPGTSDNINLVHQNNSQGQNYSMEYQNQNQDHEYSNLPQTEKIASELRHYHSESPDIIEIDNGQNAISEVDSSAVNTFTMNDGGNNSLGYREKSKKPRMQLPCHLNQVDQNASHTLQLFDDNNDHYSEQMGTQADQGYPGINREHQNLNQKHHPSMGEDSDSEIIVIGEKVNTQVNSRALGRFPMNATGYVKRSRVHPPSNATVFVQRNLSTSVGRQNSQMDQTDKRILVRSSEKSSISLSNPDRQAQNPSKVWQKADHLPKKFSTAPQILTGRPSFAPAVVPGPLQQQGTNIMRNDTLRHRQRPNVQYKMYKNQNMTDQPTARILVGQSRSGEQFGNTRNGITALKKSVIEDRDMINIPSTSRAQPQVDRIHQHRPRNFHPSGSFFQEPYANVAQNGVPIEYDDSDFYNARDLHDYTQQVQGYSTHHRIPLADFDNLSPSTSSNLGNRPGDSDQDGEINNTQTYQVDPEMYQDQPRSLAPEEEQIQVDGGMMHDNPNEPNDAPQQVNDDDEDDEFRIGTHEDDFDPDEFEGLLDNIPDEFN
ncbi:hypothetical protein CAEBREN_05525 [Caenorhabditis brenneri]|uniref:Nuclear receptor domain-containing protein n=1 Tax=Caenorhabditis brenneri TaxID=135651 RepID=G0MD97_CAEBE|nr:hypothetical protein CAEBREN_05525 [Caenorhabditis brenneri]